MLCPVGYTADKPMKKMRYAKEGDRVLKRGLFYYHNHVKVHRNNDR